MRKKNLGGYFVKKAIIWGMTAMMAFSTPMVVLAEGDGNEKSAEKHESSEEKASSAEKKADHAESTASEAKSDSSDAKSDASDAKSTADDASHEAHKAGGAALDAGDDAARAVKDAKDAVDNVRPGDYHLAEAADDANKAGGAALDAADDAERARKDADAAIDDAKVAAGKADKAAHEAAVAAGEAKEAALQAGGAALDAADAMETIADEAKQDAKDLASAVSAYKADNKKYQDELKDEIKGIAEIEVKEDGEVTDYTMAVSQPKVDEETGAFVTDENGKIVKEEQEVEVVAYAKEQAEIAAAAKEQAIEILDNAIAADDEEAAKEVLEDMQAAVDTAQIARDNAQAAFDAVAKEQAEAIAEYNKIATKYGLPLYGMPGWMGSGSFSEMGMKAGSIIKDNAELTSFWYKAKEIGTAELAMGEAKNAISTANAAYNEAFAAAKEAEAAAKETVGAVKAAQANANAASFAADQAIEAAKKAEAAVEKWVDWEIREEVGAEYKLEGVRDVEAKKLENAKADETTGIIELDGKQYIKDAKTGKYYKITGEITLPKIEVKEGEKLSDVTYTYELKDGKYTITASGTVSKEGKNETVNVNGETKACCDWDIDINDAIKKAMKGYKVVGKTDDGKDIYEKDGQFYYIADTKKGKVEYYDRWGHPAYHYYDYCTQEVSVTLQELENVTKEDKLTGFENTGYNGKYETGTSGYRNTKQEAYDAALDVTLKAYKKYAVIDGKTVYEKGGKYYVVWNIQPKYEQNCYGRSTTYKASLNVSLHEVNLTTTPVYSGGTDKKTEGYSNPVSEVTEAATAELTKNIPAQNIKDEMKTLDVDKFGPYFNDIGPKAWGELDRAAHAAGAVLDVERVVKGTIGTVMGADWKMQSELGEVVATQNMVRFNPWKYSVNFQKDQNDVRGLLSELGAKISDLGAKLMTIGGEVFNANASLVEAQSRQAWGNELVGNKNSATFTQVVVNPETQEQTYVKGDKNEEAGLSENLAQVTVPFEIMKNYVDAMKENNFFGVKFWGIGRGEGSELNEENGGVVFWETTTDENGNVVLTGKYYKDGEAKPDGTYFKAFEITNENDGWKNKAEDGSWGDGYHMNGTLVDFRNPSGNTSSDPDGKHSHKITATLAATNAVTIADETTPLAATIEDEETPLAFTIEDEMTPLSNSPQTGDNTVPVAPVAAAGVLALAASFFFGRKKKED